MGSSDRYQRNIVSLCCMYNNILAFNVSISKYVVLDRPSFGRIMTTLIIRSPSDTYLSTKPVGVEQVRRYSACDGQA